MRVDDTSYDIANADAQPLGFSLEKGQLPVGKSDCGHAFLCHVLKVCHSYAGHKGPDMKVAYNFRGGAELERALKGLGSHVAGRLGLNATRSGARVIANAAKTKAPIRTGELRESIRTFDDRAINRLGGRERTVFIGSRLFYAYFVEFGAAHTPAQSFLRGAVDESANDAVNRLSQNLGNGIEREAAKHKGR